MYFFSILTVSNDKKDVLRGKLVDVYETMRLGIKRRLRNLQNTDLAKIREVLESIFEAVGLAVRLAVGGDLLPPPPTHSLSCPPMGEMEVRS